jgi:hypothetical protein
MSDVILLYLSLFQCVAPVIWNTVKIFKTIFLVSLERHT